MKRRSTLAGIAGAAALAALPSIAASALPPIEVFKDAGCGCCGAWVAHLKAAGFAVKVHDVDDTGAARKRLGMPDAHAGCHTAAVDGYAIEGHVPAQDIKRLLGTKPAAIGLAVPGMPVGSPGMEQGPRVQAYDVLLIDKGGRASVFARYPKT